MQALEARTRRIFATEVAISTFLNLKCEGCGSAMTLDEPCELFAFGNFRCSRQVVDVHILIDDSVQIYEKNSYLVSKIIYIMHNK